MGNRSGAVTPSTEEIRHEIRLLHAERQPLRQQPALAQPIRRGHHRRGAVRRDIGNALGVDRRASFQHPRRPVVPRPGARLYRRAHATHPVGTRGHRPAAASPDPRGRAMGQPRSAQRRTRGFRRRPRLRPPRIRPSRRVVRRQPVDLRGRHGDRAPPVVGGHADLASRSALCVRRRRDHAAAGAAAHPDLRGVVLQAIDRTGGAAGLRPDRRAVRRGDDLRRTRSRCATCITQPARSTAQRRAG